MCGMVAVVALTPMLAAAQSPEVPRAPWGAPDLQAVWDYRTLRPLERPEELGDKAFLTEEEAVSRGAGRSGNEAHRARHAGRVPAVQHPDG